MKTQVTTVTERGQVSIPADVRRRMGLKAGMRLAWEAVSDSECRVTTREPGERVSAHALRGYAKQFRPLRPTSDWMRELRAGERD